jgi:uncharacterized protein (DUF4415 family)
MISLRWFGPSVRRWSVSFPSGEHVVQKKGRFVRYTRDEVRAMLARGEDQTDWARVRAMSQDEVERLADEEDGPLPEGWEKTIVLGIPEPKQGVHIRLDADVLRWFKAQGPGYQTRINAVLRAFMAARRRTDAAAE